MASSFTLRPSRAKRENIRRRILVTGAAGRIGSFFAETFQERYELRLMVREGDPVDAIEGMGEIVTCDLSDLDGLKRACEGIDTVVHLAAQPHPAATWQQLLEPNIVGTYHLFAAAKSANCRRVIFASSIHAVSGYSKDVQVKTSDPANPGDLYGVSKVFGEALARYMAEQEGLSSIAVRIGAFQTLERARQYWSVSMMDAFVSREDLMQLFERCIEVERVQFAIVHGLSNNRFKRLDLSTTRQVVGYEPKDDLTKENPQLAPLNLSGAVQTHSMQDGGESGLREEIGL